MSSHHFVREGQEPALIIAVDSPGMHPSFDQLAGWNPIIISFDYLMPHLEAAGISCDHLLVADRRNDWNQLLHGRTEVHESERKDYPSVISDILSSFDCRSARYLTDVENNFETWQAMADRFDLTVISPTVRWVYVRHGSFKKWLPAGYMVELHGKGEFHVDTVKLTDNKLTMETEGMCYVSSDLPFWWGESLTQ